MARFICAEWYLLTSKFTFFIKPTFTSMVGRFLQFQLKKSFQSSRKHDVNSRSMGKFNDVYCHLLFATFLKLLCFYYGFICFILLWS